ncbi:Gp49 family protein [Serratia marcescens]|uniref:Gp49 family protein n=1 Tax=Serratia marcescens TaxID=615 RepID=UPI0033180B26
MTEQAIEQEIQAAGKTAPRVTPARIESIIVSEHYFTAADGVQGHYAKKAERYSPIPVAESLCLLTFCVLELANGFTVTGESACASPENFDPEIGRKIARENARNKIWQLEGYLLKQQLHDA